MKAGPRCTRARLPIVSWLRVDAVLLSCSLYKPNVRSSATDIDVQRLWSTCFMVHYDPLVYISAMLKVYTWKQAKPRLTIHHTKYQLTTKTKAYCVWAPGPWPGETSWLLDAQLGMRQVTHVYAHCVPASAPALDEAQWSADHFAAYHRAPPIMMLRCCCMVLISTSNFPPPRKPRSLVCSISRPPFWGRVNTCTSASLTAPSGQGLTHHRCCSCRSPFGTLLSS